MPVYFLYSQTTLNNEYGDLDKVFQYFTFGNLGGMLEQCSSTSMTFDGTQPSINLQCKRNHHYIKDISYYGFMYKNDARMHDGLSQGSYQCEQISGQDYGQVTIDETSRLLQEEEEETDHIMEHLDEMAHGEEEVPLTGTLRPNNTKSNLDSLCQSNSRLLFQDDKAIEEV